MNLLGGFVFHIHSLAATAVYIKYVITLNKHSLIVRNLFANKISLMVWCCATCVRTAFRSERVYEIGDIDVTWLGTPEFLCHSNTFWETRIEHICVE